MRTQNTDWIRTRFPWRRYALSECFFFPFLLLQPVISIGCRYYFNVWLYTPPKQLEMVGLSRRSCLYNICNYDWRWRRQELRLGWVASLVALSGFAPPRFCVFGLVGYRLTQATDIVWSVETALQTQIALVVQIFKRLRGQYSCCRTTTFLKNRFKVWK